MTDLQERCLLALAGLREDYGEEFVAADQVKRANPTLRATATFTVGRGLSVLVGRGFAERRWDEGLASWRYRVTQAGVDAVDAGTA